MHVFRPVEAWVDARVVEHVDVHVPTTLVVNVLAFLVIKYVVVLVHLTQHQHLKDMFKHMESGDEFYDYRIRFI